MIVAVITLTSLAATVQLNPTIGVFVKPISGEFGWSRSAIAGAVTIGTLCGGALALAVGPLIDRAGARWVLFTGFLVMGGALVGLGFINALWQLYLIFIMSRMIVQGIVNLANSVAVAKWFVQARGRALSITNLGQRAGNGVTPLLAQVFISTSGWRTATVAIGLFALGVTLVPVALWLRRQPEDMGLAPDGRDPSKVPNHLGAPASPPAEASFTVRQAVRTSAFYLLVMTTSFSIFVGAGINFNMLPLLTDRGLSNAQGIAVVSAWSFAGIPATILAGLLADKLPVRYLLAGVYVGIAVGIFILSQVHSVPVAFAFAVLHGGFFGAMPLLQNLVFPNYFGRSSLGGIVGLVRPFQMVPNAVGPLAAAWVFDATGSYVSILFAFVGLMAIAAIAMLLARPPGQGVPGGRVEQGRTAT